MFPIAFLLAAAASHPVADPPTPAQLQIDRAVRQYQALDFQSALDTLAVARRRSPGRKESAEIEVYTGLIDAQLGKDDLARAAFRAALTQDPNTSLPKETSPKILTMFEETRRTTRVRPISLATPVFAAVGLSEQLATFYTDHFCQKLGRADLRVTTASEIATMLGFERQKQLMGCNDASQSCMAELANALGVDGVVKGSIAKLGKRFTIDIKVLAAQDARTLVSWSARADDEDEALQKLERGAAEVRVQLLHQLRPNSPALDVAEVHGAEASPIHSWFWAPGAAAVLAGGIGAYLMIDSNRLYDQLSGTGPALPVNQGPAVASQGNTEQTVGVVLLSAAVLGAAASVWMFTAGSGEPAPTVALGVSPGGFAVQGHF